MLPPACLRRLRGAAPEPVPYVLEPYGNKTRRLYGVLGARIGKEAFLAGDDSIADIATFPRGRAA